MVNVLATTCYALQRLIEITDSAGLILTSQQAEEAADCLALHLRSYMWLAAFFYQRRIMHFKIRCKTHYMFHVAEEIREWRLNISIFENFAEETFLGKIKRIAIRCHGGTTAPRMFSRYLLCLAMALKKFRESANVWE